MANGDRIIISGFEGVQEWATNKTAQSTLSAISGFSKTNKDQLAEIIKILKKNANIATEQLEDLDEALSDLEDQVDDTSSALDDLEDDIDSAGDAIQDGGSTFKDAAISTSSSLIKFGGVVAGIASGVLSYLGSAITDQYEMTQELYQSGIDLAGQIDGIAAGMGTLGHTARMANLTLSELANLTKEYGNTINQFGIQRFGKVTKSITADLSALGITSSESAEYLAQNLEVLRSTGHLNKMTEDQQRQAVMRSIEQTDKWSKILGKSRQELEAQAKAAAENERVALSLRRLPEVMQGAVGEVSKQFGPAADAILQTVTSEIPAASQLFEDLGKAGLGEARGLLIAAQQAFKAGDSEGFKARMTEYSASVANADKRLLATQESLDVVSTSFVGDMLQVTQSFESVQAAAAKEEQKRQEEIKYRNAQIKQIQDNVKLGKITEEEAKKEIKLVDEKIAAEKAQAKAQREATKTFVETKKEITTIPQQLAASIFENVEFMNILNGSIEKLGPAIDTIKEAFIKSFGELFGGTTDVFGDFASFISGMIADIAAWMKPFTEGGKIDFEGMFSSLGDKLFSPIKDALVDGLVMALGAVAFGALLKTYLMTPLMDSVKGLFGGGGGGDGGRDRGRRGRGGGAGGGIGKAIGGLAGGVLGGIAKGLSAFASPQVMIGALAFSAAIAAVGAGIAGATYLLGGAMPKLAEGMKSLEVLDGASLQDVGLGIAAVGAGMAAFGTGGAVGAVSGAIGGLVEGVSGLFGAKSPTEKLQEFADMGPGLTEAGTGIQAVGSGLLTFTQALNSMPDNSDKLEDMVDAINNLDINKLNKLQSMTGVGPVQQAQAPTSPRFNDPVSSQVNGTAIPAKSNEAQSPKKAKEDTSYTANTESTEVNSMMKEQTALLHRLVNLSQLSVDNSRKLRRSVDENW